MTVPAVAKPVPEATPSTSGTGFGVAGIGAGASGPPQLGTPPPATPTT